MQGEAERALRALSFCSLADFKRLAVDLD